MIELTIKILVDEKHLDTSLSLVYDKKYLSQMNVKEKVQNKISSLQGISFVEFKTDEK